MKHGLTIFKLIFRVLSPYDILRVRSCKELIFETVIIVIIDVTNVDVSKPAPLPGLTIDDLLFPALYRPKFSPVHYAVAFFILQRLLIC